MKKKFEIIEHTSDVGVRAYGADLRELFENTAKGMLEIVADTSLLRGEEPVEVEVEVESTSTEDLLIAWLEELLYHSGTRNILFSRARIDDIVEGKRLKGRAWGLPLDERRDAVRGEIKAVTYHMLEVRREGEYWQSRVIFDV